MIHRFRRSASNERRWDRQGALGRMDAKSPKQRQDLRDSRQSQKSFKQPLFNGWSFGQTGRKPHTRQAMKPNKPTASRPQHFPLLKWFFAYFSSLLTIIYNIFPLWSSILWKKYTSINVHIFPLVFFQNRPYNKGTFVYRRRRRTFRRNRRSVSLLHISNKKVKKKFALKEPLRKSPQASSRRQLPLFFLGKPRNPPGFPGISP